MKKALLVIDTQEDFIKEYKDKNRFELIQTINKYINEYDKNNLEVVYIKTVLPNSFFRRKFYGYTISGTKGAKIPSNINIVSEEIFRKKSGDAFKNSLLIKYLRSKGICKVDIIGIDKIGGVTKSKLSALKFGFKAEVLDININNKENKKLVS